MATPEYWLSRKKGKQSGDLFKLDSTKTPEANIIEIIKGLYLKTPNQNDTSPANKPMPAEKPTEFRSGLRGMQRNNADSRRLSYLNALVTLICKEDRHNLGFTIDELMTCIRVSLIDDSLVIRAAALRVLRYLIKTESDVATFNNLKLPYLVTRSVDLMLPNEEERTQALRVVRRIVAVVGSCHAAARRNRAAFIEPGLLRCLAAVARAGTPGDGSGDRLSRPAIATLAEICVLNPDLFISCGGVQAVTRQLSECAQPRMAEALCGVLLHTLDEPNSRRVARIDLSCLSAPYCDFHFRPAGNDASRDEREMRLTCSRLSLLCVLRSWPGLLHFCHPTASNGLKALVAALYLPRLEVRKAILDLLYELVGLPQPEWTDEISVALDAVDPSDFQDSWRLNEGFVAAEGTSILPHLSATGPDITEIHLALLLQCFLEAGLLDGLAEVIVTSDTFISVRATVLLGQLMHLIHLFLPPQICSITPALPTLMSQASAGKPQALAAIAALKRLHSMLEARPASNSLFLDHIILYCSGAFREKVEDNTKSRKEKDNANMSKVKHETLHKENSIEFLNESDNENEPRQRHSIGSRADVVNRNVGVLVKSKSVSSRTSAAVSKVKKSANFFNLFERDSDSLIRSTLVMQNKDGNTWNWEIIRTILKETDAPPLLNLNDGAHVSWAARVVRHLQPAANKYSHADLSPAAGHGATRAGAMLVRQLLRHDSPDAQKLLEDLFSDVSRQIEAIETGSKAHECLFSPQHMCNTMCQMYFLFIGQLCHTQKGLKLFKDTRLYENLLELSTKTHHSCYVKLVISSLDYTLDSYPRDILAKTLRCPIQASRLYATQFLNVLLRASRKSRELVRKKSKLKKNFVQEVRYKDDDGNGVDMDTWVLQMLIGQIKDESKAIVKCSLGILEEAFSVPVYLEKMIPMKDTLAQNCRLDKSLDPASLDFSAVGDRGYILWLSLEVAASGQSSDSKSIGFLKKHLDFWTKSYNYRYVRVVEASVHSALTLCASARQTRARRSARPPPHVHGALAQRPPGSAARALLAAALPPHARILQRKKCSSEQEVMDLKASLWAIGNTAVTASGLQLLMNLTNGYLEDSIPVHIIRLAKYCPVYSVRATAFYVLGLIGSTYDGANILGELGWLCVRHTRHDQFPVIPDESYPPYDGSGHQYLITSPDRRYNYDADASEHSDHTDQSTAESLQSDYPKKALIADQDKDQDVVDHKTNDRTQDNRKSHTLPTQGCSVSHDRLTLTESRTVDILRDFSNYERPERQHPRVGENRLIGRMNSLDHAHEGRVRNTSESSTSGVSSCDSFLGKYAIPDRVLTLSPIPSSSSLYGMKSTSSSQKPKLSESMRRTSTSSTDPPSSPPTQLDMSGYATLKSLNKHRRPHLSESAATGSSELEDLTWLLTESSRRSKPFSSLRDRTKATRERQSKMSSVVDYDWRPLGAPPPVRAAAAPHRAPPAPRPPPPAYMGICLPQHLADLFPRDDEPSDAEKDGTIRSEQARRRVPSFLADSSNASTDNKSRATPDSQLLTSYRGIDSTGFANRSMNAAVVAMASNINRIGSTINNAVSNESTNYIATKPAFNTNASTDNEAKTKSTSNPSISIDKITKIKDNRKEPSIDEKDRSVDNSESLTVDKENNEVEYKNEDNKPDGSEKEVKSNAVEVRKEDGNKSFTATGHGVGRIQPWRHSTADCLACVRTRPPSAHELREAFFADMEGWGVVEARSAGSPPAPAERPCPRALALHHAHFMANPVHLRQTRSALLALKQRHPDVFRCPCVYSDVCALLARGTYLLCARRFLQDLFLDTNFECFAAEPAAILSRHTSVQNTQP